MSNVMKGLGLAHTLAEALDNSQAQFGTDRFWTDRYINTATTNDGKSRVLGPMLDVLRGDAEIVPVRRVIYPTLVKPGDKDEFGDGTVVLNRTHCGNKKIPHRLIIGEFALDVVTSRDASGEMSVLSKEHLLPKYLLDQLLPGIALRNFYLENPHHIPEQFRGNVLFWGTICKNGWCYYVPGIRSDGSRCDMRICAYKVIDGKDVLGEDQTFPRLDYDAVFT